MHPVMKSLFKPIIAVYILFQLTLTSFSQECYWSSQAGGENSDYGISLVTDLSGNSYLGGEYFSYSFITNTETFSRYGKNDLFLIKYDPMGNEIWAMSFGGINEVYDELFGSMVIDTLNSRLLITGSFVDHLILPDTTISGIGMNFFLLVMDLDKHVLWARTAEGIGTEYSWGITYDEMGNIYISGSNNWDATFGQTTIPKGGFLAKYTKNGDLVWAKNKFRSAPTTYTFTEATPWNICFVNEKLIVYGDAIRQTIVIDTITLSLPAGFPGATAAFLASFSTEGDVEWVKAVGSPYGSAGVQISCDLIGNIYMTGTMWGSSGIFGDDTLQSIHGDCFIAKYNSTGDYQWARGIEPTGFARGVGVSSDRENNIYFTGTFMGYGHFGPYVLFSDATSMDLMNMFITKYSEEGECIGAKQYTRGSSIVSIVNDGDILHGGNFLNTLEIGPQPLLSRGKRDVFIAKCSPITGIIQPKPELSNTLLIYANPNTGQCRVTIPEEFNHEKTLILEIYDQTGRLIQKTSLNITGESIELDIRAQAKGMYNAILGNGKKYYSGKIMFE